MNTIRSKRLKFIRGLMYLDALLLLLSVMMIDIQNFSFGGNSGVCLRIFILIVVFGMLLAVEKSLCHYLRKHRDK